MSTPLPSRIRQRSLAGLLATCGVLVGLFGMHVLNLHGVQHDVDELAVVSSSHTHGTTSSMGSVGHEAVTEGSDVAVAGCCDHGHAMDLMVMCLALLVGVGLVLTLVLAARRSQWMASSRTLMQRVRLLGVAARAGPPYTMAFSVIRC